MLPVWLQFWRESEKVIENKYRVTGFDMYLEELILKIILLKWELIRGSSWRSRLSEE